MKHEPNIKAATAPRDLPFYPDFLHRQLGGARRWVLAPRLTPALQAKGHEVAIHPKKYKEWERQHAAEVREAVRLQMVDLIREARESDVNASPEEIAAALLELPGLVIVTDDYSRQWPGSELEAMRAARAAEHAAQVAARESRK